MSRLARKRGRYWFSVVSWFCRYCAFASQGGKGLVYLLYELMKLFRSGVPEPLEEEVKFSQQFPRLADDGAS